MKKLLVSSFLSFCLLFSGLWAQNIQKTVTELVPDTANIVITVEKPQVVLDQWEDFLKPLTVFQGKTLTQMMTDLETQSGFPFSQLDWQTPWVFGLTQKGASMDGILAFPMKNKDKALAGFKKVFASGNMKLTTYNNYAIAIPAPGALPKLPQKAGFDISTMKAVNSDGVTIYTKLANFMVNGSPLADLMRQTLENSEGLSGAQGAATKKMLGDFLKLWDEGIGFGTSFVLDGKGAGLYLWTDFKVNGIAQKALKSVPPVSGTRDFYRYLDPTALAAGVVNFDPATAWAIEKYFNDLYRDGVVGAADYQKLMKARADLLGKRATFNFDMDFDAEKIKALAKQKPAEMDDKYLNDVLDSFQLRLFGAFEVKDVKEFRAQEKLIFSEAGIQKVINAMLAQGKIPLELKYTFLGGQKDGSFDYDQMNFSVVVHKGEVGHTTLDEKTADILNKVLKKFLDSNPLYYSYAGGKAFFYMGHQGLTALKAYIQKNGLDNSWVSDPSITAWKSVLPDDAAVTFGFSMNRLMALIKKTGAKNTQTLPDLAPGMDLLLYGKVRSSGNLEAGIFAPKGEIQQLVNYFASLNKPAEEEPEPPKATGPMGGRKTPPKEE